MYSTWWAWQHRLLPWWVLILLEGADTHEPSASSSSSDNTSAILALSFSIWITAFCSETKNIISLLWLILIIHTYCIQCFHMLLYNINFRAEVSSASSFSITSANGIQVTSSSSKMWYNRPYYMLCDALFKQEWWNAFTWSFTFPGLQMALFGFFFWLLCSLLHCSQGLHPSFQIFLTDLNICLFGL